jgi:hypothetical protein
LGLIGWAWLVAYAMRYGQLHWLGIDPGTPAGEYCILLLPAVLWVWAQVLRAFGLTLPPDPFAKGKELIQVLQASAVAGIAVYSVVLAVVGLGAWRAGAFALMFGWPARPRTAAGWTQAGAVSALIGGTRTSVMRSDLVLVASCWLVAYVLRFLPRLLPWGLAGAPPVGDYLRVLPLILWLWRVSFQAFGLTRLFPAPWLAEWIRVGAATGVAAFIIAVSLWGMFTSVSYSRAMVAVFFVLAGIVVGLWRTTAFRWRMYVLRRAADPIRLRGARAGGSQR